MKAAIKGFTAWSNIRLVGNSCEVDNILKELMEGERLKVILQGINRRVTGSACMNHHRVWHLHIVMLKGIKNGQDHIRTGSLSKIVQVQKPVVWSNLLLKIELPVTCLATVGAIPGYLFKTPILLVNNYAHLYMHMCRCPDNT